MRTAAYDDYFTALQTQIAGGKAPDTFELNYENFVHLRPQRRAARPQTTRPRRTPRTRGRVYPKALQGVPGRRQAVRACRRRSPTSCCSTTRSCSTRPASPTRPRPGRGPTRQAAAEKLTNKAAGVYGDYQPVSFYEFYKALAQTGGSFLSTRRQEGHLQRRQGRRGGQLADRQAGHVDADRGRDRRQGRLRHRPVQVRQAGHVAQRDLAVRGLLGRPGSTTTSWSSRATPRSRARCS